MQLRLTEVSGLKWGHLGSRAGDPELEAAQVLVVSTPSTHSLFKSRFLTHQQWRGAAPSRLAAFPGAGPASPWGSESMPGEPRADQSPSTAGGRHRAAKETRFGTQESEASQRVEAGAGEQEPRRLTVLRPAGSPQLSSAPSWTERNSARRTRASSRETSAGRPSGPAPGSSSGSAQPARPGSGRGGHAGPRAGGQASGGHLSVSLPVRSLTPLPLGRRRGFLIAPGTQRSERTTAPTDQAGQLGPQLCSGLVGTAALPGLAAGTLGREQGKRLGRGRAASLRELGHKGLCLQPERRRSSARPSSPESAPWGPALRGPAQPAASQEADCRSCCVRPRSPGRGPRRRRTPRPLHPCGKGCRRCR